jgi:signal transduction histidine kinase
MLEQVLINLLKNAEQALANQAGGRVILSAALNPRGQVTIEVADNGPGIPDEIAARMFVPFYTTRSDGSGVGLALSRQVMNAHGGTISYIEGGNAFLAQSTGARFTLAF